MLLIVKENNKNIKKYINPEVVLVGDFKEETKKIFQVYYDNDFVEIQIKFDESNIIVNGTNVEKNIKDIKVDHNSNVIIKNKKNTVEMKIEFTGKVELLDAVNIKQLPFVIPKYATYPKYTAILGILMAYNQEKAWLYNNFILLWAYIWVETREYWTDFKFGNENIRKDFCPMIRIKQIEKGKLNKNNIIKTITEGIDKGKYFFLLLDMYYIDEWWNKKNNKYHCTHQSLIYGYNSKEKVFYIADFFMKRYKSIVISYDLLMTSYISGLSERSEMSEKYITDEVFEYNCVNYEVDIDLIKHQLENFIFCEDTFRYNYLNLYQKNNIVYGLNFFEVMQNCLSNSIYNNDYLDIRPFRFIAEFNEIMVDRILYLQNMLDCNMENCYKEFLDLTCQSKIIVNLLIKYNLKQKREILSLVKEKLENQIAMEREAILKLYNILNNGKIHNSDNIELKFVLEPVKYNYLLYYEKKLISVWKSEEEIETKSVKKTMYADGYMVDVFPYEHEKVGKIPNGRIFEKEEKGENIHFYGYDDENRLIIHSLIESEMTSYRTETYYTYSYNSESIIKIGRYLDKETNEIKVGNIGVLVLQSEKPYIELYYDSDGTRNITIYNFLEGMLVSADVVSYKKTNDEYKQLGYWKENYFYSDDQLKQMVIHKDNIIKTIYPAYGVSALDNYQIKLTIMEILREEIKANVVENKNIISEVCGKWDICLQKFYIEFKYESAGEQNISTHDLELYKGYTADSASNDIVPNIFRECIYELIDKEFKNQNFGGLLITMQNNEWIKSEKIMV